MNQALVLLSSSVASHSCTFGSLLGKPTPVVFCFVPRSDVEGMNPYQ